MVKKEYQKAVWTNVETKEVNGQAVDISFSDGGSIRFARHTDKGLEFRGVMMNDDQLALILALAQDGTLQKVASAFAQAKDDILKTKAIRDEKRKLQAQEERALTKATLGVQAALENFNRLQAQIEARKKVG